ncbi:hypothetical protein [Streptomyces sp. NPDC057199]|uniref:hypothetical protein n=1 Tax=Streptomyces sp. NPDC057199 TaxID=3346047 RepID=UPI0036267A5D
MNSREVDEQGQVCVRSGRRKTWWGAGGLVHINTLLLQQILAESAWAKKLSAEDRRGLTAMFWSNINPYGTFRLDMESRLDLGSLTTSAGQ